MVVCGHFLKLINKNYNCVLCHGHELKFLTSDDTWRSFHSQSTSTSFSLIVFGYQNIMQLGWLDPIFLLLPKVENFPYSLALNCQSIKRERDSFKGPTRTFPAKDSIHTQASPDTRMSHTSMYIPDRDFDS